MIDESKFSVNEKNGVFKATFRVEGEYRTEINASSLEEAKQLAETMADKFMEEGVELDNLIEVDVDYVYAAPPMYRVMRDGSKMQVSRLKDGDIPREPDERGF